MISLSIISQGSVVSAIGSGLNAVIIRDRLCPRNDCHGYRYGAYSAINNTLSPSNPKLP